MWFAFGVDDAFYESVQLGMHGFRVLFRRESFGQSVGFASGVGVATERAVNLFLAHVCFVLWGREAVRALHEYPP